MRWNFPARERGWGCFRSRSTCSRRRARGPPGARRRRRCSGSWGVTGDAWSEASNGWRRDVRAVLRGARAQGGGAIPRRAGPIRPGLARFRRCGFGAWGLRGPRPQLRAGAAHGPAGRVRAGAVHESADSVRAGQC